MYARGSVSGPPRRRSAWSNVCMGWVMRRAVTQATSSGEVSGGGSGGWMRQPSIASLRAASRRSTGT